MRFRDRQLSYCLNVHPARSLAEVMANIRTHVVPIKARVCPDQPFGLGLWLPAAAAAEVRADPAPLRNLLQDNDLYIFTCNGFPYGVFHGERVKDAVYQPDWGEAARVAYTVDLLHVLAALAPRGLTTSISTVPVTYRKVLPAQAVANLGAVAAAAREIEDQTGQHIWLALEPEPDCFLENTAETIDFFAAARRQLPELGDYVGVCFDTCHLCLQREDLSVSMRALLAAGIAIPKVQLSAALRYDNSDGSAASALAPFAEQVYLHQTRVRTVDGRDLSYADLGPALRENPFGQWLVHFHLPLPYAGSGRLQSTADSLSSAFLELAFACSPNLEIETYTFDVLPPPKPGVVDSIAGEFSWLRGQLAARR